MGGCGIICRHNAARGRVNMKLIALCTEPYIFLETRQWSPKLALCMKYYTVFHQKQTRGRKETDKLLSAEQLSVFT